MPSRLARLVFLAGLVGLLAGCGMLPFQAQPAKRIARVGFLKQPPLDYVDLFWEGLRELGYVEGQDFVAEYHYVERADQLPASAVELAELPVDVIVAPNSAAVDAARKATTSSGVIGM